MSNILPILNRLHFKFIGELNNQTNLQKSLLELEEEYDGIQYTFHKDNCPTGNSDRKLMRQCDIIQIPQRVRVFSNSCNTYINTTYIPMIHLLFDDLYLTFDDQNATINAYILNRKNRENFYKENYTLYDNNVIFQDGICKITDEINIEKIENQNVEYSKRQISTNVTVVLPYGKGVIQVTV